MGLNMCPSYEEVVDLCVSSIYVLMPFLVSCLIRLFFSLLIHIMFLGAHYDLAYCLWILHNFFFILKDMFRHNNMRPITGILVSYFFF